MPTNITYKHGETVIYTGHTDRELGVEQGKEYVVFGDYPQPPQRFDPTQNDYLAIRVHDPDDRFGGVVPIPVGQFQKKQAQLERGGE